ncbi:hypothetical protein RU639_010165 [Aspergillus parasiticus]
MLSVEAIIAIVTLLVTCPPSILMLWNCFRRPQANSNKHDIELGELPTLLPPPFSPRDQYNIVLQFVSGN